MFKFYGGVLKKKKKIYKRWAARKPKPPRK